MTLAFVTNNAARPPAVVAEHLTRLGIAADPAEVTTSSLAAAHHLADTLPRGARVLIVGTVGLVDAVREYGLTPVHSADDDPVAVVQGYSPTLDWKQLAEGAIAIRRGLPWVATNLDATVPSPRGPLPGNGSLVAALQRATGQTPLSTGKPDPRMHRESVERSGAKHPVVVGDRLDTDIEGAGRVGCDSLLVLSGVTDARLLLAAPVGQRPTHLAHDVSGLLDVHPEVTPQDDGAAGPRWRCRQWQADASLTLRRVPDPAGDHPAGGAAAATDDLDALRALCVAAWTIGDPVDGHSRDAPTIAPGDDAARAVLDRLGLLQTP